MTTLREAAQQALETFKKIRCDALYEQDCNVCNSEEALRAALAEPVLKPAGVVTSMVKGGVTWHIWPDQMPDGTTLYAAAPIIKPEIKEDKPFGYFRAEPFGWTDCAPTDEGAIPLYERPQAQQFLYNAWADEQIQKEKK